MRVSKNYLIVDGLMQTLAWTVGSQQPVVSCPGRAPLPARLVVESPRNGESPAKTTRSERQEARAEERRRRSLCAGGQVQLVPCTTLLFCWPKEKVWWDLWGQL